MGAAALDSAVGELRHSVIRVVRTSTAEVDRRLDAREVVDIACRVSIGGESFTGSIVNLSEHGALVRGGPAASIGTTGTLTMDGGAFTAPFSVRAAEDDALHLAFALDEAAIARLRGLIERLTRRRAA
jgi:methyl-accepting chemotaxis protein